MKILVGMEAKQSRIGSLAIIDIETGQYDYLCVPEDDAESAGFRGISYLNGILYAVKANALYLFKFIFDENSTELQLLKKVVRPEWNRGTKGIYANLLDVFACKDREKVFVTSGSNDEIYEFSLGGEILNKDYVWDLVPQLVGECNSVYKDGCGFTLLNHIGLGINGNLWATLGRGGVTGKGKVVDIQTGETVIEGIDSLYDGVVDGNKLFISSSGSAVALSYHIQVHTDGSYSATPLMEYKAKKTDSKWLDSKFIMRGLIAQHDKLIAAVSAWSQPGDNQLSSRILVFNQSSGQLERDVVLPEIEGLEWQTFYNLCELPSEVKAYLPLPKERRIKLSKAIVNKIETRKLISSEDTNGVGDECEALNSEGLRIEPEVNSIAVQEKGNRVPKVSFENVSLSFPGSKNGFIRTLLTSVSANNFWALRDVTFNIYEHEVVGIIGRNGSGKSTAVKLIGGVYKADKGIVKVDGKVSVLSLRAGFKPELTGRDNIYLRGAYLGLSREQIDQCINEIIEFSELKSFIDEPVRHYSSGMGARLAFAIGTVLKPELLVIDEALSTGDSAFREKASKQVAQLVENSNAVIIVSHQMNFLKELCSRIIWLDKGEFIMEGEPQNVIETYAIFSHDPDLWLEKWRKNQDSMLDTNLHTTGGEGA